MLAACGGEVAGCVEIVGCGIEKFGGGQIVCAITAADYDYGAIQQCCSCSFGARRRHRWARRNASRLRIVNIGCVQGVCAVARAQPIFTISRQEHTSELQSHSGLVCRLLPEKIKTVNIHWSMIENVY